MRRRLLLALALLVPAAAGAGVYTWVDADGVTHMADDPAAMPPDAHEGRSGLRDLWREGPQGKLPALQPPPARHGVEASRSLRIVEGAVGMVENALEMLAQKKVIDLDEERKAAMVSNLLVVLCGTEEASPVINTGTLYA